MNFLKPDNSFRQAIDDLILFSRFYPIRSPQMLVLHKAVAHPFLKEGMGLLLEGVLDEKCLHRVLRNRMECYHRENFRRVDQLKFVCHGILALTLLVVFFCALGGSYAAAGWTLLASTFITSALLAPFGLFLKKKALRERAMNEAVVLGLHLISTKTNAIVVSEELNSFLPLDQRIPWVAVALTTGKKAA